MNIFNIERSFTEKTKRRWNKIFIAVDVHDVILDDKAGFEGDKDWFTIEKELKRIGEWKE